LIGTLKRQVCFLYSSMSFPITPLMPENIAKPYFCNRRETQNPRSHKQQPAPPPPPLLPAWGSVSTLSFFSVVLWLSVHTSTCRAKRARHKWLMRICIADEVSHVQMHEGTIDERWRGAHLLHVLYTVVNRHFFNYLHN
jgi:hypothetical protein